MTAENKLYGLVVCGGKSARMGIDKSKLIYYNKQIRYHLYEILDKVCSKVFISCNSSQVNDIDVEYKTLVDSDRFENTGPMAALLTAFEKYPEKDFLVIGCDYPFLNEKDLTAFLKSLNKSTPAAAFYNIQENLYEPLLACYSNESADLLSKFYLSKNYSLQAFLKATDAEKFIPGDKNIIKSINTPEEFSAAIEVLKNKKELFS